MGKKISATIYRIKKENYNNLKKDRIKALDNIQSFIIIIIKLSKLGTEGNVLNEIKGIQRKTITTYFMVKD